MTVELIQRDDWDGPPEMFVTIQHADRTKVTCIGADLTVILLDGTTEVNSLQITGDDPCPM